jgi:hypothetical protein
VRYPSHLFQPLVSVDEFSRIISQFSVTHQNIKAELDVVLRAYDEAQASLERAMKQREQLKKAAQDTRQDQFNQLNFEWMCEYILNSVRFEEAFAAKCAHVYIGSFRI